MELKHIKTKKEEYYEDEQGRRQGEYKRFYGNGNLWLHSFWKDDKLKGKWQRFYINGNLYAQCFYKEGKLNGKYKRFSENGELKETEYYQNGVDITSKVEKLKKWN